MKMTFILGAQKCGTTTLHHWLSQHPNVLGSSPKEPKYFELEYYKGTTWYLEQYFKAHRPLDDQMLVDGRVRNLLIPYVPDRIYETFLRNDPKFIILFRDPIERAYSAWNHFTRMRPGREEPNFEVAMQKNLASFDPDIFRLEGDYVPYLDPKGGSYKNTYLESGWYWYQAQRYIKRFGERSVYFICLDDLAESPEDVWYELLHFLQLPYHFLPNFSVLNVAPIQKDLPVSMMYPHTWNRLSSIFSDDLNGLSEYLNRDLKKEWW